MSDKYAYYKGEEEGDFGHGDHWLMKKKKIV